MADACALAIISGRIIFIFVFVAVCEPLQTHFHERGRNDKMHLLGQWAGSFSEDRPLGWDPVAEGNRAGDGMARFVSEEKAAGTLAYYRCRQSIVVFVRPTPSTAVLIFFQLLQPHTPSTRRLVRRWKPRRASSVRAPKIPSMRLPVR